MAEIRHLENRHDVIFFCRGWSDLDKISEIGAEWHADCGDVVEVETCRCRIPIWRTFGRIYGMSSQSHVSSHCWMLLLGEFIVTFTEPHATLQGAVIWRNQCHDRATLQGARIPSAILKIVLRHILFLVFTAQCYPKRGICQHAVSVRPSVCLSVRPSVMFVSCVKTNKDIFEIFSPPGSQAILVFPYRTGWRYSDGNPPPPNEGVECMGGMKKWQFSTNISLYLRNGYS